MPTLTCYPTGGAVSPADGYVGVSAVNTTFSAIRTLSGMVGAVTGSTIDVLLIASSTTNQYDSLRRGIFCFDTSSIPVGAVISSATIKLYGSRSSGIGIVDLHIASATPATTSSFLASDYAQTGNVSFGSVIGAAWLTGANTIALNANGIANITKGGVSKFSAKLSWDINNNFTGAWTLGGSASYSLTASETATVANKPTLTVNYTLPNSAFMQFVW